LLCGLDAFGDGVEFETLGERSAYNRRFATAFLRCPTSGSPPKKTSG